MALSRSNSSLFFLVPFLLAAAFTAAAAGGSGFPPSKEIHLHLYLHIEGGSNGTSFVVAGLNGTAISSDYFGSYFGDVLVFDNILREGPEPNSTLVGRAQGMGVKAGMADLAELTLMNLVFTEGKYNGSALAVLGRAAGSGVSERSVVGGSGHFRQARGYLISKLYQILNPLYAVAEFDLYIMHY